MLEKLFWASFFVANTVTKVRLLYKLAAPRSYHYLASFFSE